MSYGAHLVNKPDCEELFASFDDKACGSASIGQVHKAILHDGREVAVKVQFPGRLTHEP